MKYTESEILEKLKQDRESGAAMVMEEYAGLLWSVCRKHLEDAEDVKECVNSTFADFCLCPEKYDESKGSLKNYLCRIADHKAIDRYRSNCRRQQAEEAAEQNLDSEKKAAADREKTAQYLEAALDQLEPMDSQIIRMKYYDGMSYQEIADKLGLKESAVKMRSMRSRKKLLRILIAILVMLLLAACVAAVLRHYQFSDRGGVVWSDEPLMYEMTSDEYTWEIDDMRYTITDALFLVSDENTLEGSVVIYITAEAPGMDLTDMENSVYFVRAVVRDLEDMNDGWVNGAAYALGRWRKETGGTSFRMSRDESILYERTLPWSVETLGQDRVTIPLYLGYDWLTDITLEPVPFKEYEDNDSGRITLTEELEWVVGPAVAGENNTIVSMSQFKTSDWKI